MDTDYFDNHEFQKSWAKLKIQINYILEDKSTSRLKELSRTRKIISDIDNLLADIDVDLIDSSIPDTCNQKVKECLKHADSFLEDLNVSHIEKINNSLSAILFIWGSMYAQLAWKDYKYYVSQMKESADSAKQALSKIEDSESEIVKIAQHSKGFHSDIEEFHKELLHGDETKEPIARQINQVKKEALRTRDDTLKAKKSTDQVLTELNEYYKKVFGDGYQQKGLKTEIDLRIKELDTMEKSIESLLPGAISAGLASAFKEMKDSYSESIKTYSWVFYGALLLMLLVGAWIIYEVLQVGFSSININQVLTNLILKAPLFLPLAWWATFASRRMKEYSRLQQEYAHKETLARSYISFRKEAEKMGEEHKDLEASILKKTIEAVAFNPSETLDRKSSKSGALWGWFKRSGD